MKTSEALALVLHEFEHNADYKHPFICLVTDDLYQENLITYTACYRIKDHINKLLDGNCTLSEWLKSKHKVKDKDLDTDKACTKLRITRIAWIKDMIRHFKALGD